MRATTTPIRVFWIGYLADLVILTATLAMMLISESEWFWLEESLLGFPEATRRFGPADSPYYYMYPVTYLFASALFLALGVYLFFSKRTPARVLVVWYPLLGILWVLTTVNMAMRVAQVQ